MNERIDPERPDPDALLARLKREERSERGKLRVYLGMAPGVGKTYAALNELKRRLGRGSADAVVGYVETYGRPLTEQALAGLEVIPRRAVTYKGVTLEEMDTEAIIARRPDVVLVDELAHTNAPGSAHAKRWQDVEQLRDQGISVIATLNVQHLESLNELVENITGVKVRETVPDTVLDGADEIELIDITPEALRSRLRHGNIYPAAQAAQAAEHFFRPEHLAALRQLALQRTAQEVEQQVDQYMRESPRERLDVTERILVLLSPNGLSRTLIRRGWRITSGLHADLFAAVVESGQRLDEHERRSLESHIGLAEDLGATVVRLAGRDRAQTLAAFARAERVTQIIVGRPERRRWWPFGGSEVDRLARLLPDVDIHVIAERRPRPS